MPGAAKGGAGRQRPNADELLEALRNEPGSKPRFDLSDLELELARRLAATESGDARVRADERVRLAVLVESSQFRELFADGITPEMLGFLLRLDHG